MQPRSGSVSVKAGPKPVLRNAGFYIELYGIPAALRASIIVQTADPKATQQEVDTEGDAAGFLKFKLDQGRLQEMLDGKSRFGRWAIKPASGGLPGVKQLYFVSPDGVDHDYIRVLFNESRPDRKLLAYVRDPSTGGIQTLFAWDYREDWKPVRFLKIDRYANGKLHANLQNILYSGKTTNVDRSLFRVDLTQYRSVDDFRSERPVSIVDGKVYTYKGYGTTGTVVTNIDAKAFLLDRFGLNASTNSGKRSTP